MAESDEQQNPYEAFEVSDEPTHGGAAATPPAKTVPPMAHVLCGWPILLVAIGGAIGGALGGAAYGVNIAIYKSDLPLPVKVVLNLVVGATAVVLWFFAALAITQAIQ